MIMGFLNPHLQTTGRLVDYALRKRMHCIGFVCTSGAIYDVNLGARHKSGVEDMQMVMCVVNESSESQLCRLRDRIKKKSAPFYAIVDDDNIEDGYRCIDAVFLGLHDDETF